MRKTLLLVIKDQLEFRFLVNDHFLLGLLGQVDIALMCPANTSGPFRDRILEKYPDIRFVDDETDEHVRLIDRFIYWLKNEVFFILNAGRSETCFQKVFLSLELPLRSVVGRILEDRFARTLSPFFNGGRSRQFVRWLLRAIALPLGPFRSIVLRHRRFYSPIQLRERFDYILFGRSYAVANIAIHKAFAASETKVITFCRNFDVPASKGVFTIPSDYTIVFDAFLHEHLRALNSPLNYGQTVLYEHPVKSFRRSAGTNGNGCKSVMYAANSSVFVPNESEIVARLYDVLDKEYRGRFRLFLRPHPTDYSDGETCRRFEDCLKRENVFLEKMNGQYLDGPGGGTLFFPLPQDIREFYDRLQDMDLVLSSFSTINYEAHLLGVPTAFLNVSDGIGWLVNRDHLRLLTERHGIAVLTDLDQVKGCLS